MLLTLSSSLLHSCNKSLWRAKSAAGKETEQLIWQCFCPYEAHALAQRRDIKYVIISAVSVREAKGALGQKRIPRRGAVHVEAHSTGMGAGGRGAESC